MTARRPTKVRVGAFTFRVDQSAPAEDDTMGEMSLRELVIRVDGTVPDPVWRECFLHELMHACHVTLGLDAETPTNAENVVGLVSPLLFEVLARDHALRAYLFGVAPKP